MGKGGGTDGYAGGSGDRVVHGWKMRMMPMKWNHKGGGMDRRNEGADRELNKYNRRNLMNQTASLPCGVDRVMLRLVLCGEA